MSGVSNWDRHFQEISVLQKISKPVLLSNKPIPTAILKFNISFSETINFYFLKAEFENNKEGDRFFENKKKSLVC